MHVRSSFSIAATSRTKLGAFGDGTAPSLSLNFVVMPSFLFMMTVSSKASSSKCTEQILDQSVSRKSDRVDVADRAAALALPSKPRVFCRSCACNHQQHKKRHSKCHNTSRYFYKSGLFRKIGLRITRRRSVFQWKMYVHRTRYALGALDFRGHVLCGL